MKMGLIIAAFVIAFLSFIVYTTVHGPRFRAQICMTFEGRHACKTVISKTQEGAVRAGTEGSCADIASGVTETMKCVATPPDTINWLK